MADSHPDLERFFDDELSDDEARGLRRHLADCPVCHRTLNDLIQIEAGAARSVDSRKVRVLEGSRPVSTRVRRRAQITAFAATAALMAITASALATTRVLDSELWLSQQPTRMLELRLSSRGAARYRRFEASMSRGENAPSMLSEPPRLALAWLELRGELVAIADAFLLRGQPKDARMYLDRADRGAPSADSLASRAALDLSVQEPEDAFRHASQALRLQPTHPAALWNRALALRALELPLVAAQEMDAVAALNEKGWTDEARALASTWRGETNRRRQAYEDARNEWRAAMRGEAPYPHKVLDSSRRLTRLWFYDALRAAGTTGALAKLEPVAKELDERFGGDALMKDMKDVKARMSVARRPALSGQYALEVETDPGAEEWLALADAARTAHQSDIELGALFFVPAGHLDLERYKALAQATQDPWFMTIADEKAAEVDNDGGQPLQALERLRLRRQRCELPDRVEDRCLKVERWISYTLVKLNQTLEARKVGQRALKLAKADGDWDEELLVLQELGQAARVRADLDLTRAYFDEVLARTTDSCGKSTEYAHSNLALAYQQALDFAEARRQVDLLSSCDRAPSIERMFAIADLQRIAPRPRDDAVLKSGEEAMQAHGLSPGKRALVTHLLGRARLEHDRVEGEHLLQQAITEAERLPSSDPDAHKARFYSYTSLLLDAAKRGDYLSALRLAAQERHWASPPPCSIWLASDDERLLIAAMDPSGRPFGRYDGARYKPVGKDESLVPPEFLSVVGSCSSVQVLARPPLEGRAHLLPLEVAWSETVRSMPGLSTSLPGNGPRLVVAFPNPPVDLHLLPLYSAPPRLPNEIRLEGPLATPSAVLQKMHNASLVEFHVHGIINPEVAEGSYLALSPEMSRRFELTAEDVRKELLTGHPLVLLAACHSAETTSTLDQGYGLPKAFVDAGARAVLAVIDQIPDNESELFFRPLIERIQLGMSPAVALRDARVAWHRAHGSNWVDSVLLFE